MRTNNTHTCANSRYCHSSLLSNVTLTYITSEELVDETNINISSAQSATQSDDIDPFTVVTKQIFAENTLQGDISRKKTSLSFGLTLESFFAQEDEMKNFLAPKVLLEDR